MRGHSRFIPGDAIDSVAQWRFGSVDTEALSAFERERQHLQAEAQARDAMARQQGYAEGFEEGRRQAELAAEQRMAEYRAGLGQAAAARLAGLIDEAGRQMQEAGQRMAEGVLELGTVVARQVLRQELSVNPNVLLPLVREALELLAEQGRAASVRLHPSDLEAMGEALEQEFARVGLSLTPDTSITPGGCLVSSAGAVVDATVQGRWQRALAQLGLSSSWDA